MPRFTAARLIAILLTFSASLHAQDSTVFGPRQVDVRAGLLLGAGRPDYPRDLRRLNIEGRVVASFVVLPTGVVSRQSVNVTEATHGLLAAAVRSFLAGATFGVAVRDGRAVSQAIGDMEFNFGMSSGTPVVELPSPAGNTGAVVAYFPPLADSSVRIRSVANPFQDNKALYVIDGVPLIDPGLASAHVRGLDIQSVDAIRGAAAASLYGSRASSGVIAITTRGARGGGGRGGVRPLASPTLAAHAILARVGGVTIPVSPAAMLAGQRGKGLLYVVDDVAMLDAGDAERLMDFVRPTSVEIIPVDVATRLYGSAGARGAVKIATR